VLTVDEIERARYHLGYPEVAPVPSIQLGIPRAIQTAFLFELAVQNLVNNHAENRVRRILNIMDGIETKLVDAQDRLAADQLEELKLRKEEPWQLEGEYQRWGYRLAETLGCPVYAYSTRYSRRGPGRAGSFRVSG
jgi:hypothetical protein